MGGGYTHSVPAPSPGRLFLCFLVLSALVFLRPPDTSFIFDEQEALLGNPYLNEGSRYFDALQVDFWGRAPGRTIGSYRPLPNLLWWPLRRTLSWNTPWVLCLLNLVVHAGTATVFALLSGRMARRTGLKSGGVRLLVWATGMGVLLQATATEAVCSAVGLADLLVGFFSSVQLLALAIWFESKNKFALVSLILAGAVSTFLGLLSKETMLASAAWLPVLLVLWSPEKRLSRRTVQGAVAGLGAALAALIAFVSLREKLFPAEVAQLSSFVRGDSRAGIFTLFFQWFGQPKMPVDPLNNPLIQASIGDRWATACRLFLEQFLQLLFPWNLSADHSYPRERVTSWGIEAYGGALLWLVLLGIVLEALRRRLLGLTLSGAWLFASGGGLLFLCTYLPVSNLFALLPTIRGDRLLYAPALGTVLLATGVVLGICTAALPRSVWLGKVLFALGVSYFGIQTFAARMHAFDYNSDLEFWRAASRGRPASAKSHLNLGVMVGARGDERARLTHTLQAVRLAPEWPMGQVYLGDVYCRLGDLESAWPHYFLGFSSRPNSKALIALGLQCLWEQGGFTQHRAALLELTVAHSDSWLDYFVKELAVNGTKNGGIAPKYRPRKYNARPTLR